MYIETDIYIPYSHIYTCSRVLEITELCAATKS